MEAQQKPLQLRRNASPTRPFPLGAAHPISTRARRRGFGGKPRGPLGPHGQTRNAADEVVVRFFPSSLPWPANSALPTQTAAQPLQPFMPTHPPPHSRRPARNKTSSAATASLQGRMPTISLRTAQRSAACGSVQYLTRRHGIGCGQRQSHVPRARRD